MTSPEPRGSADALRLAWCTHEAARFAVMRWHYSKAMPAGRLVRVGVWERGTFVGCVLFGLGSGSAMARAYERDLGLRPTQFCELVRIALGEHATPVSRIVAIALRMLRGACPDLALVVSFADPEQGHHGGVYQAGGWVYTGRSSTTSRLIVHGRTLHDRSAGAIYGSTSEAWIRENVDPHVGRIWLTGKHRYFFPLDEAVRAKVERLRLPYPKPGEALPRSTSTRETRRGAGPSTELRTSSPVAPEEGGPAARGESRESAAPGRPPGEGVPIRPRRSARPRGSSSLPGGEP